MKLEVNWNLRYKPGENKRTVVNEKSNSEFKRKTTTSNLSDIWKTRASLQEKYTEWSKEVTGIAEDIYVQKKKKKKEIKAIRSLRRRKKEIVREFKLAAPEEKETLIRRKKLINEHIENHQKEETKRRTISIANSIKSEKGFDGSAFWEFKKRNSGRKREEITIVKNEDGEEEEEPEKILEIYQKFW